MPKTRPELNEAVILGVADAIEREPELYNQSVPPSPDCNSPCCVAGWAPYVKGGVNLYRAYFGKCNSKTQASLRALQECFGITLEESWELYSGNFMSPFDRRYCGAITRLTAAKAVADMLREVVRRNQAGEPLGL